MSLIFSFLDFALTAAPHSLVFVFQRESARRVGRDFPYSIFQKNLWLVGVKVTRAKWWFLKWYFASLLSIRSCIITAHIHTGADF